MVLIQIFMHWITLIGTVKKQTNDADSPALVLTNVCAKSEDACIVKMIQIITLISKADSYLNG